MQPAVAVESLTANSAHEVRTGDSYPTYPGYAKGSSSKTFAKRQQGIPLKSVIIWILRPCIVILLISVFFLWTGIVNDQINHYTDDKIKWADDRPSVAMNASKAIVISNNEYCNDIVREILVFNFSVEAAGRVMMHCLWLTEPHKTSPLGHNFFAVINTKTQSNEVIHSRNYIPSNIDFLRTLYTRRPVLQKRGIFSIGLSRYTRFLGQMKLMAGEGSDEALSKMEAMTDEYKKIPISASLKIALDRNRWDLPHDQFKELYDGIGNPKEIGDMLNGKQLMNNLVKAADRCAKSDQECSTIMDKHVNQTIRLFTNQLDSPFLDYSHPKYSTQSSNLSSVNTDGRTLLTIKHDPTIVILQRTLGIEPTSALLGSMAELMNRSRKLYTSSCETAAVYSGFVIMDNTGAVVMGGSGLNSEFGAMTRGDDGMVYNNVMTMYDMEQNRLKYELHFVPLVDYNESKKKLLSVSLMMAPNYCLLSDYLINWVANRIKNNLSYSTGVRMPGLFFDNHFVSIAYNEETKWEATSRFFFTKGTPPSEVDKMRQYILKLIDAEIEERTWDDFPVDIMGVDVSNGGILEAHMTSSKKQAAQLAGI